MASWRGRYINPWKWEDDWHMSLGRDEQKVFDYLLDCPRSAETQVGVYQLSLQVAAFHTKIDLAEIKKIFERRLQPDGKAFFEIGWVIVPNWIKHQHFNENMWKAARNEFNGLPEWLKLMIFDHNSPMYIDVKRLSQARLYFDKVNDSEGLLTVSYDSERFGTLSNRSQPSGNKNKKGNKNNSPSGKENSRGQSRPLAGAQPGQDGDNELEEYAD